MLFFAITSAPLVMNAFCNAEFIFNCDYNFTDRYTGETDYFLASEKRALAKEGLESEEENDIAGSAWLDGTIPYINL